MEMVLPDGGRVTAKLDDGGILRLDGLAPGVCSFSILDLE
jgi:hypothetical protein